MAYNDNDIYTPNQYENIYYEAPIVAKRAPTVRDKYEIGKVWIDKINNDAYFITSITGGSAIWINAGGGAGTFASVTSSTGNITATLGDIIATAGNLNIAGTITFGALGAGTLRSSAAGVVSSLTDGTDGTVLIGTTGGTPAWATLTAGAGITIAEAAGTITITNPGATGTTSGTDVGGPVSPTGGGLTTFEGYDTNIATDGATANTVRIRLADDIVSVASITSTNDLDMLAGTCTIVSDDNNANAIYLHANAGVNEQIHIRANQGTAANSVVLSSDAGGLLISGGLNSADAINIQATDAAGGIDVDYGSGGMSIIGANGTFTVESGTAAISIGADAAAHAVTLGSTNTTASLTLQSGTGDVNVTSTDKINLDAVGTLEINSSAGIIGIGNDAVAQNINIGTGAAARVVTVGNSSGASQVVVDCGTGGISIGESANAHATTIGSTNTTSNLVLQTGSGSLLGTFGGIVDVNAVGAVTIDSSAGAIGVGVDADDFALNLGIAGARTVTLGSATGASSTVLDCGTGAFDLGVSATDHTSRLGSTTGVSALTLQAGTGAMTFTAGGAFDANATGAVTIDSSGGAISIGADDIDQAVNIATDGERTTTIGSNNGAAGIVIDCGTGDASFGATAIAHTTTVGSTTGVSASTLQSGTGAMTFTAGGIFDVNAAGAITLDSSAGTIGIGVNAISQNINIGTAGTRTVTIGSSTATSAVDLVAGSGNVSCNTDFEFGVANKGLVFQAGPKIVSGAGTPHGSITAPQGSLYLRTNGTTTNDRAYINTDGGTTWTALTTAA